MVTRILFDPRRDLTDGSTTASPVTIEATPTGIRTDGQTVIYPGTLTFTINTGADPFQLPANTASNAWRIVVKQNGTVRQQRTVRVPVTESITWQALPDIVPASLQINPGTALQWDATFWAIMQLLNIPSSSDITFTTPGSAIGALTGTGLSLTGNGVATLTASSLTLTGGGVGRLTV